MNRFAQTSGSIGQKAMFWLPIFTFVLILVLFLNGINSLSDTANAKQQESLENALARDIAQCYAVEGIYPPDLEYLVEHYGLTYDPDKFLVDYVSYGSNLRPEVTVLRKKN
jgi:ABC-type uncharacterized transport system involved in gliding motility auxiliary subunit